MASPHWTTTSGRSVPCSRNGPKPPLSPARSLVAFAAPLGNGEAMILEGIVTTISPETGEVNIAPMGPHVDESMRHFVLRPYPTSQTYKNLKAHGEGVLHVTDDVLLLAKA